jgi:hypothetical protein
MLLRDLLSRHTSQTSIINLRNHEVIYQTVNVQDSFLTIFSGLGIDKDAELRSLVVL